MRWLLTNYRSAKSDSGRRGIAEQIPRDSLILIMLSQFVVSLPHVFNVSFWALLAIGLCVLWRWMIFSNRWVFPNVWVRILLVVAFSMGVLLTEGIAHRIETWTALLMVAFALKLIETKTRRDGYAVLFLACFVLSTTFIYDQGIGLAIYVLVALLVVIAGMVSMNQWHAQVDILASVKASSKLLAQAIPFALVLFVLFPRIPPMWSVPTANTAQTGLPDEVSPGDIASLAKSDAIAFRVTFDDAAPSNDQLYWRALVYPHFAQGTWSLPDPLRDKRLTYPIDWVDDTVTYKFVPKVAGLDKVSYQVLMEPTNNRRMFALDLALSATNETGLTRDYRLVSRTPIKTLTRYSIDSYPQAVLDSYLPSSIREANLSLPVGDNPRMREYARRLYRKADGEEDYIEKVLQEIREKEYRYTLRPPLLPKRDSVDTFWFDTQAGFCSHYAGAFVYLMRAAGIPARMVGGYQGGESNPVTGHMIVRQYQAHAWAEVWLEGRGWVRVDPTAAVAPERVEQGLDAALSDGDRSSLSAFTSIRLGDGLGLARLMYMWESLEYRWYRYVVGYDSDKQNDFLKNLLGEVTPTRIAIALIVAGSLCVLLIAVPMLMGRSTKPQHPVLKIFSRFVARVEKKGWKRQNEESPTQFILRLSKLQSSSGSSLSPLVSLLERALFDPKFEPSKEQLADLEKRLERFRLSLVV